MVKDLEEYINKLKLGEELFCDFHCIINVYDMWKREKSKGLSKKNEIVWAESLNVNLKSLYELDDVKNKIEKTLENYGISIQNEIETPDEQSGPVTEQDLVDQNYILKFMIAGAFYPNYYRTQTRDDDRDLQRLTKNPLTTISVRLLSRNPRIILKLVIHFRMFFNRFRNFRRMRITHFSIIIKLKPHLNDALLT